MIRHNRIFLICFLLSLFICGNLYPVYAFPENLNTPPDTVNFSKPSRVYYTERLTAPKPVIDGELNDECWQGGNWATDFHQWIPDEGAQPSQRTEFKILYDDKNIYVAFRAFDTEPDKIQRYAGLRDDFAGDICGVNFDSYHDHRTGFEFDLTAYGQKIDLVLTNPENWDTSWNPVWYGKVGMEDSAWTGEMEIPLSQLRYSSDSVQVWGMHFWRWINRLGEESDWEQQSRTGPGVLYLFGELRGIKNLKKSQRLEIMPYGLGKLSTFEKNPASPFADKGRAWNGTAGLDAKIGLTSNFTVDLTINPDFGQVESDPSVLNLTAFETFYQEKRPFFLEGKTIFDYDFDDLNLFYSRRIGHAPSRVIDPATGQFVDSPDKTAILSAVKLSGKTADGLSIGVLQSITAKENAKVSETDGTIDKQTVEPLTSYTVARIQKDYHEGNTVIGGILTSTNRFIKDTNLDFLSNNALTGGIDFLHQWHNKKYYIDTRFVGSHVNGSMLAIKDLQESSARYYQRPGASYLNYDTTRTFLDGYGGKFKIGKGTGLWKYSTQVRWISPGLELNDIGYMQSADLVEQQNEILYQVNHPVSIFRLYSVNLEQFNHWNFNGTYLGSGAHLSFDSQFTNKWNFQFNLIYHSPIRDMRILRGGYVMKMPQSFFSFGYLSTNTANKISANLSYDYTRNSHHSLTSYQISPGINLRPVNTLRIGLSADYANNNDALQYVTTKETTGGTRYILGSIDQQTLGFTFRVDYSITPEFSIQYYGSPFVSRGTYSEFKYITDPMSKEYDNRFSVYKYPIYTGDQIWLDENNDNTYEYSIDNPDFNFHQFRSNFVAKWEYRPGSLIYFVWSSERTANASPVNTGLGDSMGQLWNRFPDSIFLIKFSYWFAL